MSVRCVHRPILHSAPDRSTTRFSELTTESRGRFVGLNTYYLSYMYDFKKPS